MATASGTVIPAFAASNFKLSITVHVKGARFALRTFSQSFAAWSATPISMRVLTVGSSRVSTSASDALYASVSRCNLLASGASVLLAD